MANVEGIKNLSTMLNNCTAQASAFQTISNSKSTTTKTSNTQADEIVKKINSTISNKTSYIEQTCKSQNEQLKNYATEIENCELALSGGANLVSDNSVHNKINNLPDLDEGKNITFNDSSINENLNKIENYALTIASGSSSLNKFNGTSATYQNQTSKSKSGAGIGAVASVLIEPKISADSKPVAVKAVIDATTKSKKGNLIIETASAKYDGKPESNEIELVTSSKSKKSKTSESTELQKEVKEAIDDVIKSGVSSDQIKDMIFDTKSTASDYQRLIDSGNLSDEGLALAKKNLDFCLEFVDQLRDAYNTACLRNKKIDEWWTNDVVSGYVEFQNGILTEKSVNAYVDDIEKQKKSLKKQLKKDISVEEYGAIQQQINMLDGFKSKIIEDKNIYITAGKEEAETKYEKRASIVVDNIILQGVTSSDINKLIDDNNAKAADIKNKIKNNELTGVDLDDAKMQLTYLNQISKQLGQKYGKVYTNEGIYDSWASKQIGVYEDFISSTTSQTKLDDFMDKLSNREAELQNKLNSKKISAEDKILIANELATIDGLYNHATGNYDIIVSDINARKEYQDNQKIYNELVNKNTSGIKLISLNADLESYKEQYANAKNPTQKNELAKVIASTESKIQHEENLILNTQNNTSTETTPVASDDKLKNLYSDLASYEKQYANAKNPTQKNEIGKVITNVKGMIDTEEKNLGLNKNYDISVYTKRISGLDQEISAFDNKIDNLTEKLNHVPTSERSKIQSQISSSQKEKESLEKFRDYSQKELYLAQNDDLVQASKICYENAALKNNNINNLTKIKENNFLPTSAIQGINKQIEDDKNLAEFYTVNSEIFGSLSTMNPNNTKGNVELLLNQYMDQNLNGNLSENKQNHNNNVIAMLYDQFGEIIDSENKSLQITIDNLNKSQKYVPTSELSGIQKSVTKAYDKMDENYIKWDEVNLNYNNYLYEMFAPKQQEFIQENENVQSEEKQGFLEQAGINQNLGDTGLDPLTQTLETTSATISQTATNFVWGFERAFEGFIDFLATGYTGIVSIGTSIYDAANGNFGKPNSLTAELYRNKDKFVQTEWINNAANSIYDTNYGKWVDQNALYNHEGGAANFVQGVGEVTGVILSGKAVGEGSANKYIKGLEKQGKLTALEKQAITQTYVKTATVGTATAKGFGQGNERGLNLGFDTATATNYGVWSGAWDGLQFYVGQEINSITNKALSNSTSALDSTLIYTGSILADAVDSGIEGFVQPAIQTMFNGKSFNETFEENGGWDSVWSQAAIGAAMSAGFTRKEYNASLKNLGIDLKQTIANNAKKTVATALSPVTMIAGKYIETPMIKDTNIYNIAKSDGLYHITDAESAAKIKDSGYIKASKDIPILYDNNKAYMFAGIPDYDQVAANLKNEPVLTAVKVMPDDAQLSKLNYRSLTDNAVSNKGNFNFSADQVEVVHLGLMKDADGNLVYREIPANKVDSHIANFKSEGIKIGNKGFEALVSEVGYGNKLFGEASNKVKEAISNLNSDTRNMGETIRSDIQSKINVDDIKTKAKNTWSAVKGTAKVGAGGLGLAVGTATGNPALSLASLSSISSGAFDILYSTAGNYIQDSEFIVRKGGKSKIDGTFKPDSISEHLSLKGLVESRFAPDNETYFLVEGLNTLQQLKKSSGGEDIVYYCRSHGETQNQLKRLKRLGYITDLEMIESGKSYLTMEKLFMGGSDSSKPHPMYDMTFKLTDKQFDAEAAKYFLNSKHKDLSYYDATYKNIDGKDVVLYNLNTKKVLRDSIKQNGINGTMKKLSGIDLSSLNIKETAATLSKDVSSTTKHLIFDLTQTKTGQKLSGIFKGKNLNIDASTKMDLDSQPAKKTIDSIDSSKTKKVDVASTKVSDIKELKLEYAKTAAEFYSKTEFDPVLDAKLRNLDNRMKTIENTKLESTTNNSDVSILDTNKKNSSNGHNQKVNRIFNELKNGYYERIDGADYLTSLTPEQFIEYQKNKIAPENVDILHRLSATFSDSNPAAVNNLIDRYNYLLERGNPDIRIFMEGLIKLKEEKPGLKIHIDSDGNSFYLNNGDYPFVHLDINAIEYNTQTVIHEFNHLEQNLTNDLGTQLKLPDNYEDVCNIARHNIELHRGEIIDEFKIYEESINEFIDFLRSEQRTELQSQFASIEPYFKDEYKKEIEYRLKEKGLFNEKTMHSSEYQKRLLDSTENSQFDDILTKYPALKELNLSRDYGTLSELKRTVYCIEETAFNKLKLPSYSDFVANVKNDMNINAGYRYTEQLGSYVGDFAAFSEMVSALSGGMDNFSKDTNFELVVGHHDDYYKRKSTNIFEEAYAEFSKLKKENSVEVLGMIKKYLGEEYYNMLDTEYNRVLDSFKDKINGNSTSKINISNNNFVDRVASVSDSGSKIKFDNVNQAPQVYISNDILGKIDMVKNDLSELGHNQVDINKSLLEIERAIEISDTMKQFDGSQISVINQMGSYFGDGGSKINEYLMKGLTKDSILNRTIFSPDRKKYINFFDNTREGKYISSLTKDEINAINYYSKDSGSISNFLRKNIDKPNIQQKISDLDSAISKYGGIDEDMRLYRGTTIKCFSDQPYSYLFEGVNPNDLNTIYAILKSLEGEDFKDKSYLSTSPGFKTSFATREDMNVVFDIVAPKGTEGAYINQISRFYNSENEFLIARNTNLKILDVSMENIAGRKKVVVKCIAPEKLYDSTTMALSTDLELRQLQEKMIRGEELTFKEKFKLGGRDKPESTIGNYECKSDHCYRAISEEVFEEYKKKGYISDDRPNSKEYSETLNEDGSITNNNAGIDWYLGGYAQKYGDIIIEVPADKSYFVPAFDNGTHMTGDTKVRHMKSSPKENPIPFSAITNVFDLRK